MADDVAVFILFLWAYKPMLEIFSETVAGDSMHPWDSTAWSFTAVAKSSTATLQQTLNSSMEIWRTYRKWIQQLSASYASKLYRFKDSARKKLWTICMYSAVHDLWNSSNCYIVMISLIFKFHKLKDIDSQTSTMAGDSWRLAIAAWVMAMWNRSHWRTSSPNIWFMVIPAPSTQAEQKVISFIQATETATSLLRLTSCHRNGDVMPLLLKQAENIACARIFLSSCTEGYTSVCDLLAACV